MSVIVYDCYILAKSSNRPPAFINFLQNVKWLTRHAMYLRQLRYWQNVQQYIHDANLNSGTPIFKIRILGTICE